ncbi:MAG: hypothetical protein M1820_008331 [Bogoriella megaspora]|nr:MAG: hypothetical protein M1820_008331 [Bogoriella megaspora]
MWAQYAAQLLYVASLLFSRLAVLGLLDFILAHQKDKWKIHALGIFIVAWSAVAELVFAFECRLPHPWKYIDGHCFSRDTWFNAFDAISILIDLSLIVLPTVVIWHVRTSILKRLSVISFFATRVIVVIASICDIVFWDKFGRSSDPTLHGWPIIICTQTIQCLSIIAACVLFLKPFLETLESGFIRSDNLRRRGSSSVDGYGNYNLSKVSKRTAAASRKTLSMALGTHNSITAGEKEDMTRNSKRDPHDWDASSQNSQSHIIRKDRTFNVTFSPAADSDQRGNRVD